MSEDDGKGDFTIEDWMEYAEDLERQLKEKDDEIADLNKGSVGRGRGKKSNAADTAALLALEEEVGTLQDKVKEDQATIAKLRKEVADANIKVSTLSDEKSDADKKIRTQAKQIEDLEKEIKDTRRKAALSESQTKDFNKQKSANVKISQQLTEENEALRDENRELAARIKTLESEKQQMENVLSKFAEEKDTLTALHDHLDVEKETLRTEIAELENDLAEAGEHLQSALKESALSEDKYKVLVQEMQALKAKHASDLAKAQAESSELKAQIAQLRDTSKVGQAQKAVEESQLKSTTAHKQVSDLQAQLALLTKENADLASRLADAEEDIEERVSERVTQERGKAKALEVAIESLKRKHADDLQAHKDIESAHDDLVQENDELKNWKAVYEAGHGLQQLSRNQKKLTDDNRRLTQALEQRTTQFSALLDTHNLLALAFERLKRETGHSVDFAYPEAELQEEVRQTTFGQQLQIQALEEQLDALEEDNTKLRKQLRATFGTGGSAQGGVQGLTPEQQMQVHEFAVNLKEGLVGDASSSSLDAPRSRALFKENQQLRKDIATMNAELLRYEREAGGAPGGVVADVFGADMKALLDENAQMRQMLQEVKQRLDGAQGGGGGGTGGGGGFNAAELSKILAANNEMILREFDSTLKQQKQQPHHPTDASNQHLPPTGRNHLRNSSGNSSARGGADSPYVNSSAAPFTPRTPGHRSQQPAQTQSSYAHLWTPHMHRVSNNGSNTTVHPQTPFSRHNNAGGSHNLGPQTPSGKSLLSDSVHTLQLPPEEWAVEVKDLYAQLVECLETLFERDYELQASKELVDTYERSLSDMKLQSSVLYHDFAQRNQSWAQQERNYKQDLAEKSAQIDDLQLKVRRLQEMHAHLQQEDPAALAQQLHAQTRKLMIYEVNEAILSRKYMSLNETLQSETRQKTQLQADFLEMESSLKERILFLEHFKEHATQQLVYLQTKLEHTVSAEDYKALTLELESLREDHLHTLRREVEARGGALAAEEHSRALRSLRLVLQQRNVELSTSAAELDTLRAQVTQATDLAQRSLAASQSPQEVAQLVSEMAKSKGDVSRLLVELLAANTRAQSLQQSLEEVLKEVEDKAARIRELEVRAQESSDKESSARHALVELQLRFEGGLTRTESEVLRLKSDQLSQELQRTTQELQRQRTLADIAVTQAQHAQAFNDAHVQEVQDLRDYCVKLESRGDEEVLLGRLQRELMSTRATYKAFTRKYQHTREHLRHREIALRMLETQLLDVNKERSNETSKHQKQLSALQQALETLKSSVIQIDFHGSSAHSASTSSSTALVHTNTMDLHSLQSQPTASDKKCSSVHLHPKRTTYLTFSHGSKLAEISSKLDSFAQQASNSLHRTQSLEEELHSAQHQLEDVSLQRQTLLAQIADLESVLQRNGTSKQQQVASRLIALSEENRLSKLSMLQLRRQLQHVRAEVKQLRTTVVQLEEEVATLERGKVEAEGVALRVLQRSDEADEETNEEAEDDQLLSRHNSFALALLPSNASANAGNAANTNDRADAKTNSHATNEARLSIDINNLDNNFNLDEADPEALHQHLQSQTQLIETLRQSLRDKHATLQQAQDNVHQRDQQINEQDAQLVFYEKILREHRLDHLLLRTDGPSRQINAQVTALTQQPSQSGNSRPMLSLQEQQQVQAAATATIQSLQALLEEKSRLIESYRDKLDSASSQTPSTRSRAVQQADKILDVLAHEEHVQVQVISNHFSSTSNNAIGGKPHADDTAFQQLSTQLETAEQLLADKDKVVRQLETKLQTQTLQCERAELRCAESLEEIDAMKHDMMQLLQQLQASEARYASLSNSHRQVHITSTPAASAAPTPDQLQLQQEKAQLQQQLQQQRATDQRRIQSLERALKAKDEKVQGYREIVVRLKEEFIKSEEENAVAQIQLKAQHSNTNSDDANSRVSQTELLALREKLTALSAGIKRSNADVEKAKRVNDKLTQERDEALKSKDHFESALHKQEAQLTHAQNVAQRFRKELEEARKKEVRLREKLKDFLGGAQAGGQAAGGTADGAQMQRTRKERLEFLERENELLKAQLAVYRNQNAETSAKAGHAASTTPATAPSTATAGRTHNEAAVNLLGTAANRDDHREEQGHSDANKDDLRSQLHSKWEAEKKLQKRLGVLEKRLTDLVTENDDLRAQLLKQTKEQQGSAVSKRDKTNNNNNNNATATAAHADTAKKTAASHAPSLQDIQALETARARIFSLESQVQQLTRKCDVELTNQVRQLAHQLSSTQQKLRAAELEVVQYEERRKKERSGERLRQSEDRFLTEERLRDEVDFARRQRTELESALLDRDAKALELRFENETLNSDRVRLQRRIHELEEHNKTLQTLNTGLPFARPSNNAASSNTGGNASRREQELEAVVESMRRVVDKLKADNERLRRSTLTATSSAAAAAAPASPARDAFPPPATAATATSAVDFERKYQVERKKNEKLNEELQALQQKAATKDDQAQKLAQKQQQVVALQKKLQKKEEDEKRLTQDAERSTLERETLQRRVEQLQTQLQQQLQQQQQGRKPHLADEEDVVRKVAALQAENDVLQLEISDLRNALRSNANNNNSNSNNSSSISNNNNNSRSATASSAPSAQHVQALAALQAENDKLRAELSAFDLDFFEEIENLKFAHAEAMRKLRLYETRHGPLR